MKSVQRAFVLIALSALLAACAATGTSSREEAVVPAVSPGDAAIKKDVDAAVAKEPQFAGAKITVSAKDSEVTLSGEVKNDWLKYLAEDTAKKANKDVKSVKNSLKVPE